MQKVEGVYKLKQQTPTDTMGVGLEVGVNLEKKLGETIFFPQRSSNPPTPMCCYLTSD